MKDERLIASVIGVVQGVGFRWFVLKAARGLDLKGYVMNRADGSVEVVAEGPRDRLERLLADLRAGPRSAVVRDVIVTWEPATGEFDGFDVGF